MQNALLRIAAALECFTGVAVLVAPGALIALLLGIAPTGAVLMVGRVLGVALLPLGIVCWGATTDLGSPARTGTLGAITLYNAGVGVLLVVFAATGMASGWLAWVVGILHLGIGVAFVTSLRYARTVPSANHSG